MAEQIALFEAVNCGEQPEGRYGPDKSEYCAEFFQTLA